MGPSFVKDTRNQFRESGRVRAARVRALIAPHLRLVLNEGTVKENASDAGVGPRAIEHHREDAPTDQMMRFENLMALAMTRPVLRSVIINLLNGEYGNQGWDE